MHLPLQGEPGPDLDALWAQEAEDRLAAYRRSEISALPLTEVLGKYMAKPTPAPGCTVSSFT